MQLYFERKKILNTIDLHEFRLNREKQVQGLNRKKVSKIMNFFIKIINKALKNSTFNIVLYLDSIQPCSLFMQITIQKT